MVMRKRRRKKAIEKILAGQPLTQNELWTIHREIRPVKVKGLVPAGRGRVKTTVHEARRALELSQEMAEATARNQWFEKEAKEREI